MSTVLGRGARNASLFNFTPDILALLCSSSLSSLDDMPQPGCFSKVLSVSCEFGKPQKYDATWMQIRFD